MDRFAHALGHAQATLQDIARGVGKSPRASRSSIQRLKAAAKLPPVLDPTKPLSEWEQLQHSILTCTKCPHLVASRTQVVFGVGNPQADLLFVGEAPGADEDEQGEPFVGRAGQLLTKIIQAMGLSREEIFIANVLKCRPDMPPGQSGNRKPKSEEMATCLPWLTRQIELIKPRVIVALGATAAEGLLGKTDPMAQLRGHWFDYADTPVLITYHPAYLLRNQSLTEKRKVWEDMLLVMEKLELPISTKQRKFFLQAE
jgi:uracil-DNA glycosylase